MRGTVWSRRNAQATNSVGNSRGWGAVGKNLRPSSPTALHGFLSTKLRQTFAREGDLIKFRRISLAKTSIKPDPNVAPPPRKLGEHGTALWNSVQREYGISDIGGIELLCLAAQS